MKIGREHKKVIETVMDEFGIETWSIERGRKHPVLVFMIGDRDFKYVLPGSPSDGRASKNCRADLRRLCRLHPAV